MFKFLKHIGPKTKILVVACILVLIPGAVISYLSLQSIREKAENLRIKYSGTLTLVRDKLESEISALETGLRSSILEQSPLSDKSADLKEWLRKIESENPAFMNLFLVNADGGLISSSVSIGWTERAIPVSSVNPKATASYESAEHAEFILKDLPGAIIFYNDALARSVSSQEQALMLSRLGRCYFKMGQYGKAISEYKKIPGLKGENINIGNVPAPVIALTQIADSYEALKAEKEYNNTTVELYGRLLNQPWDLKGGDYNYYLKSADEMIHNSGISAANTNITESNINELMKRAEKRIEQINYLESIDQDILPEIISVVSRESSSDSKPHYIYRNVNDSTFIISFLRLPLSFQKFHLSAIGYQFQNEYILSGLFPEALGSVALGKDILVGIVNAKDSLLYIQDNFPLTNYLMAENFSDPFVNWKVALFDPEGKSMEQLTGNEKQLYLILFVVIILVMLLGVILMIRSVIHESEVSRMKSEFVSNVSHEFKTPLALIRMFGETLDSGIVDDEKKRREFYSIIRKESERLTHLINNVLDFSRMDTGVKEYNFEIADLVRVVLSCLEAYKFHIRDLGFEFEVENDINGDMLMARIDKDAISQALLNLLSNAVKYSEDKKYIRVRISRNSTSALISVTDHGIGIPKKELKKIFDKFYRVTAMNAKQTGGSGLGLTLVKNIVEAHGGSVEVESEIGNGSTFTLLIPLNVD
jgi:signal transduction histidine kinase